jgi:hypothetical protein
MITEKTVFVSESEYQALQQWEDDGGASIEIVYVIVQDCELEQHSLKSCCDFGASLPLRGRSTDETQRSLK